MSRKITTVDLGEIREALVKIKAKREIETGANITLSEIIREKLFNDPEVSGSISKDSDK